MSIAYKKCLRLRDRKMENYKTTQTPIQRNIARAVTNNRGYITSPEYKKEDIFSLADALIRMRRTVDSTPEDNFSIMNDLNILNTVAAYSWTKGLPQPKICNNFAVGVLMDNERRRREKTYDKAILEARNKMLVSDVLNLTFYLSEIEYSVECASSSYYPISGRGLTDLILMDLDFEIKNPLEPKLSDYVFVHRRN
jgi:hypothetical protein